GVRFSVQFLALSCLRDGSPRYLAVDPQPRDHPCGRSHDSAFAAAACAPRDRVMTSRRTFVCALAAGLLATPFAARAQKAERVYRLGFMFTTSPVSEMAGPEPIHPLAELWCRACAYWAMWKGRTSSLSGARPRDGSSDSARSWPSWFASKWTSS